jgi:hypothetical protein
MRHHIPHLVSQIGSSGRYFLSYFHTVTRSLMLALSRFESPREALRVALQDSKASGGAGWRQIGSLARRSRPLLIHYHIFKNAGTSFEWALEQALGCGLHRYDKPDAGDFVSGSDIVRYVGAHPDAQAIVSHQAAPPAPRIRGRQVLTSILIRDPIARIRSIYAFERLQRSDSRGSKKARELDFKGYVQWRLANTPPVLTNGQVHFCCRDGGKIHSPATQSDLKKAIAVLDDVDIVGTVERYEEWLRLAESILTDNFEPIVLPSVRHNRTGDMSLQSESEILDQLVCELGADLARQLLEQNELDMRLHQVADSLLSRRLAERSLSVRLRDAYASGERATRESSSEPGS